MGEAASGPSLWLLVSRLRTSSVLSSSKEYASSMMKSFDPVGFVSIFATAVANII